MPDGAGDSPRGEGPRAHDKYRDNDDVRDPVPADERMETSPDTKSEARGDARENIGRNARGTDAHPTGPEGNDNTKGRADRDLEMP